jgi:hypothetical protein
MKRAMTVVVAVSSLWASIAGAAVNCEQVKKYLKTGRTPQDVADTMVISIDDVKKCQGESTGAAQDAGKMPSGEKAAGSTAAPEGSKSH